MTWVLWCSLPLGIYMAWRAVLNINHMTWHLTPVLMIANFMLAAGGFIVSAAPLYDSTDFALAGYSIIAISYALTLAFGRREYERFNRARFEIPGFLRGKT